MTKRVRATVRGVVQGVGFRMYTQRQATRLGINGYVRNLPDGNVEIVAEGDAAVVDRLVDWARNGPPSSRVEGVDVTDEAPTGEFDGFSARY
jgi:acylphosphatase